MTCLNIVSVPTYTKYSVLMNVSSCLYTESVCSYAVNNHIILKFRISMSKPACTRIWKSCRHWNLEILQKSSLKSGNLPYKFFWKSWNLKWNLEISMKSWNLSGNPEFFSEIPRFRNLVATEFSVINPSVGGHAGALRFHYSINKILFSTWAAPRQLKVLD